MSDEIVEQLKRSRETIGEMYPKIVDFDGEVLSGRHREKAGWKGTHEVDSREVAKKLDVTPLMAKDLLRLHLNIQRKPSSAETKALLMNLAQELLKKGVKKEDVASELVKIVPYKKRWVLMLLPQDLKKPVKVEAGKVAGAVLHQKIMARLVECSLCYMGKDDTVLHKGKVLCGSCLEKVKHKPVRSAVEIKPRVTTTTYKETWEHRKAVRSPQVSKMEQTILEELEKKGLQQEFQKEFCIRSTRPDYYFPKQKIAIYLDGPVHKGREDRDEAIRDLLYRRHGVKPVGIAYEGDSEATINQIVKDILGVVRK